MRSEILWSAITRVQQTEASWLLFYGSRHAVSIPTDQLSPEQEAQLRDLLAARQTAPA